MQNIGETLYVFTFYFATILFLREIYFDNFKTNLQE